MRVPFEADIRLVMPRVISKILMFVMFVMLPWPMGDHMIFAMKGIPTIAITASEIFDLLDTVVHSPGDNMSNIDLNILNNIVYFISDCMMDRR